MSRIVAIIFFGTFCGNALANNKSPQEYSEKEERLAYRRMQLRYFGTVLTIYDRAIARDAKQMNSFSGVVRMGQHIYRRALFTESYAECWFLGTSYLWDATYGKPKP